jgi:hypothetical protein
MSETYQQMPVACNVSSVSLGDALYHLGVMLPKVSLMVSYVDYIEAKFTLKEIGAFTRDNPLSPFINLIIDHELLRGEWYLECDGKRIGCKGP